MIPLKQKHKYIKDVQHGDCWSACVESILECEGAMPYWNINTDWATHYTNVLSALDKLGYSLYGYDIHLLEEEILNSPDTDGYVIAIGKSPRSTENERVNHAVVWRNGIVHDPHPDNTGILDIISFEVLIKNNQTTQPKL